MDEDMYYPGSLNGNRGLVPCNFVSQIESPVKSQTDPKLKSPGYSQSKTQSSPPANPKPNLQTTCPKLDLTPPKNPVTIVPKTSGSKSKSALVGQISNMDTKPESAPLKNPVDKSYTTRFAPLCPKPALPTQDYWETPKHLKLSSCILKILEHEYWCEDEEGGELFRVVVTCFTNRNKETETVSEEFVGCRGEFLYTPKQWQEQKLIFKIGRMISISELYERKGTSTNGMKRVKYHFQISSGAGVVKGYVHGLFYLESKQDPIPPKINPGTRVKCMKDWEDYNYEGNFHIDFTEGDKLKVIEWEDDISKIQPEGWFMGKSIGYGRWGNKKAKFHVSYVSDPLHEKVSVWSRIKSVALD